MHRVNGSIEPHRAIEALPGLITYAVKEELRGFPTPLRQSSRFLFRRTGIGPANADRSIRTFLKELRPAWVISTGFAGGLNPHFSSGTVGADSDPAFPFVDRLPLVRIQPVHFHLSPRILTTQQEKAAAYQETGADAVEMESAVICDHCRHQGIPSATIRVILDPATQDLPLNFNAIMNERFQIRPFRLAVQLLRHPGKITELGKFHAQVRAAAAQLGQTFNLLLAVH